jgi:hypothetical protein
LSDAEVLRELHDAYAWEVNAAVGEDRMDLVWRLVDEYTDKALQLVTEAGPRGCGRADCVVCSRPRPAPVAAARRRWRGRLRRHHAA